MTRGITLRVARNQRTVTNQKASHQKDTRCSIGTTGKLDQLVIPAAEWAIYRKECPSKKDDKKSKGKTVKKEARSNNVEYEQDSMDKVYIHSNEIKSYATAQG